MATEILKLGGTLEEAADILGDSVAIVQKHYAKKPRTEDSIVKEVWCQENPAQGMDMPPDPKPRPREPYTAEEIAKIIAATDAFGKGQYERLRARAMILLMRYYGLRVSDVATLRRDRIRGNQIFLHALKNGAAIWLPLDAEVDFALCAVPKPYGAEENGPYVFWSGRGDVEEHTKTKDGLCKQCS